MLSMILISSNISGYYSVALTISSGALSVILQNCYIVVKALKPTASCAMIVERVLFHGNLGSMRIFLLNC
jgi:hypothetical protein